MPEFIDCVPLLLSSCDPNMETQKWTVGGELRIGFFSLRTIKAGEECTIDYQYRQNYGEKRRKCYCGSELCCGVLGGSATTNSAGTGGGHAARGEEDDDDELADDDSDVAGADSDYDSEADDDSARALAEKAPVFVTTGRIKTLNVRSREPWTARRVFTPFLLSFFP